MQDSISETIMRKIYEGQNAKSFPKQIANQFTTNEKVKTSNILSKFIYMQYKGKGNIAYTMKMSNIVTRLRGFNA